MGPADPTTSVELSYRHAFGGLHHSLEEPSEQVYKPDNPAGCGWLPDADSLALLPPAAQSRLESVLKKLSTLTAPQIDHPDHPVQHPTQRLATEGFGPMARWCEPRLHYVGPCDENWRRTRFPLMPEDFDPLFYQSAHPDLISKDHLQGNEPLLLDGFFPEGARLMRLPGVYVLARVVYASGRRRAGPLRLDTVSIDLDEERAVLVWRAAFDRDDPVVDLAVGTMTNPGRSPYA